MRIIGQQHFKKHAWQTSAKQAVLSAKIATRWKWNYFIHITKSEVDHCIIFNELVWRALLRTSCLGQYFEKKVNG